jgi:uncharacterized membrane protein YtjA (UPF0391 family)
MRLATSALGLEFDANHDGTTPASSCSVAERPPAEGENTMLHWAAVFFVIALVAAIFGFGGIAAGAVGIAKILFFVFLVLAVLALVFGRRVPT